MKKKKDSEALHQRIKLIIGREPIDDELSFLIKWHQTQFGEKLVSSLINSNEVDRVLFSANHCIGKSTINKRAIDEVIVRAINDIECKGVKAENILLHCRSPHSDAKGVKETIRRVQRFVKREHVKTSFSFSDSEMKISIIAFAMSTLIKEQPVTNISQGDRVLLFSSLPNERGLSAFLNDFAGTSGCWIIKRVDPNEISFCIASFSRFYEKGITIDKKWEIEPKRTFFAAIVNKERESFTKSLAKQYKVSASTLGRVSSDNLLRLPKPKKIDLPISCLKIFNNNDFMPFELNNQVEIKKEVKEYSKKLRSSMSFNNTLLELMSTDECLEASRSFIVNSNLPFSIVDEQNISNFDPKRGAEGTFASAIRKIVSHGIVPNITSVTVNLPQKLSNNDYYYVREFEEGIKSASSILDIPVVSANVSFDTDFKRPFLSVVANGKLARNSHSISSAFKNPDDFILILGSHRGELGCSVYARIRPCDGVGLIPMIDLPMERQIRQVILAGNEIGIIKSVINVSAGGLSTAIANSIIEGGHNFGARIHLSSKIPNEELLFGETQGLMVISISEESIIEIERLCMNGGVPCTAIGRVTDNGQYTFNDVIDISCNKLIQNQEKNIRALFS